jgi:SNF2 family DNA or RNA helicase
MGPSLIGTLTNDSQNIIINVSDCDDWDMQHFRGRLDQLTAAWTFAPGSKELMIVPATWPTVIQLGRMFAGSPIAWRPQPSLIDWMAAETVRRKMPPPPLPEDACPPWLKLRDYQREDAERIATTGKAIILHEMGTGKTPLSIVALEARRLAGHGIFPMIIVVPSRDVADVWEEHIATWAPGWPEPVRHLDTRRKETLAALKQQRHRDYILITTYATLRLDAKDAKDTLPQCNPETVIIDEAHMIGGASAQSKAAVRLARHAPQVLELSGTLVTHSMKNVHPALEALDARSWPSWDRAKPRYYASRKADHAGGEDIILGLRPEMEKEFFACLDGQVLRRSKAQVLPQLPRKIYSVRRPEMPPEWRHAYDTMRDQMLAELPDGGELPVMGTLAKLTRLSQLASSATDVQVTPVLNPDTGEYVSHYKVTLKRPCWKADSVLGILAEREGLPTAVFTESRQLAMITGQDCIAAGLRTGFITGPGDGPGYRITEKTRKQAKNDFQAGKLDVIICTAGAGGLGITLTASDCAIMMERSFKLDLAIQPEDRLHRLGCEIHDHIQIIDLRCKDTIDEFRVEVLQGKGAQWGQLIRDPGWVRALLGGLK